MSYLRIFAEFGIILLIQIVSIALSVGVIFALAVIYDAANRSMSWYSSTWLLFGLYFCPLFFCQGLGPAIYLIVYRKKMSNKLQKGADNEEQSSLKMGYQIQMFLHAQCVIFILLLLVLTGLSIRTAFLIVITIIFYSLTMFINFITKLQLRGKQQIIWNLAFINSIIFRS